MAFRSFNKLTNAFLGEIKFDTKAILKNKIRNLYLSQEKLDISPHDRYCIVDQMGGIIQNNKQQLSQIISQETGKYIEDSNKEIDIAIEMLRQNDKYLTDYFHAYNTHIDKNKKTIIQLQPIGPVYCVHSSYKPLWHMLRSILINTRIGNPCLIRPSTKNPLIAKTLENLMREHSYDFIEFAYNSPDDFKTIISNDQIKGVYVSSNLQLASKISFYAAHCLKPCVAESGSSNPLIITDDYLLDKAVKAVIDSRLDNFGRGTENIKKIYLTENIARPFLQKLNQQLKSSYYKEKMNEFIDSSFFDQTNEVLQKTDPDDFTFYDKETRDVKVNFQNPVILKVHNPISPLLYTDKIYGPIFIARICKDEDQIIDELNEIPLKRSAVVFSNDDVLIDHYARQLEVVNLFVNQLPFENQTIPTGGLGMAGMGSIYGRQGYSNLANVRCIEHVKQILITYFYFVQ